MKGILSLGMVFLIIVSVFAVISPRLEAEMNIDKANAASDNAVTVECASGVPAELANTPRIDNLFSTSGSTVPRASVYIDMSNTHAGDNQYDFDSTVAVQVDVDTSSGAYTVDVFTWLQTPNDDTIDGDNYYGWVVQGTTNDVKWFYMTLGFEYMQYVGLQWHIEVLVRDSSTYLLYDQKKVFVTIGPIMTDHFTCRDPYNAYATRTTTFYDTETAWEYTSWDTHNLWRSYEVTWDFNGPITSHLIAGPSGLSPGYFGLWVAGGVTGGEAGSWYVDVLLDNIFRARDGFDILATTGSVTVDPNGGRIYVDESPITTPRVYSWSVGSVHKLDPDSGYSPSDGRRLQFTSWTDGNTADPRMVTVPPGAITYRAQWQTEYRLNIAVSPSGSGATNPAAGTYWHDSGGSVLVERTSTNPGYTFDYWDLDGYNVGSGSSYTVTMNSPHTLTAYFSVIIPDFSIANPGTLTISNADESEVAIVVTSINGYSSLVSLSATGQPAGVTISFTPTAIPTFTSTMKVRVGYDVPLNTYPITITGSGSDGTIRSETFSLSVIGGSGSATVTAGLPKLPLYSLGLTVDLSSETVTDTGDYTLNQGILTIQDPYTIPLEITLSAFGYSYTLDIGQVTLDNTATGWVSSGGEPVWMLKNGAPFVEPTTSSDGDLLFQLDIYVTYQLDALPEGTDSMSVVLDLTKSIESIPPGAVEDAILKKLMTDWQNMQMLTLLLSDAAPIIIADLLPVIQVTLSHFMMSGAVLAALTTALFALISVTFIALVLSPIDLLVVDPQGRLVGIGPDGELLNQIEGAFYSYNETSHEKLVLIPNVTSGAYQVMTNGTDSGEYNLVLCFLNGTYMYAEEFVGYTEQGAINCYVEEIVVSDEPSASAVAYENVEITIGQSIYYMVVMGNSTISEFSLDLLLEKAVFNAIAHSGSISHYDVTVPIKVLNDTFAILVDGSPIPFEKMENATHYMLHFTCLHAAESVGIEILVTVEGDLNCDRIVDIFDVMIPATEYGSQITDQDWNPLADVIQDGIIDIFDVVAVAIHYGDSW